jgi:hypothetical protein
LEQVELLVSLAVGEELTEATQCLALLLLQVAVAVEVLVLVFSQVLQVALVVEVMVV